ncbi:hypothetical protein O3M35_005932 [Rhynocoris fuscipes]|uniref:Uncharacterized protein n=1 Tax=Rhynocoris fuscipes TaxID=488301 RepID=A0AAW1DCA8_9HEMI
MSEKESDNRKSKGSRRQRRKHTATADTFMEEDIDLVNVIIENLEKELRHDQKDPRGRWSGNDDADGENDVAEEEVEEEKKNADDENDDCDEDEDVEDEGSDENEEGSDEEETDDDEDEEEEEEEEGEDNDDELNAREGEINSFIEIEEIHEVNEEDWKKSGHGDHDDENENSIDSYESCSDAIIKSGRNVIKANKDGGNSHWFRYAFIGGLLLGFTVYYSLDSSYYVPYLNYIITNRTDRNKMTL